MTDQVNNLLQEMVAMQHAKLLRVGRQIIPTLTSEDVLQPMDYAELELHPAFRYEEGILAGMQAIQMALRAWQNDLKSS